MKFKLEVIGFTIQSCLLAQESGAVRIELCDNPVDGGTTPSHGFIKAARQYLNIDLYPIIRPRGGDFFFSEAEFDIMKTDVALCKALGCDGIVLGMLLQDGSIDKKRCQQLVELAYPLGVSFHRAFDRTNDPLQAMEDIIEIGCERVLTSGLQPTASEGADLIAQLITVADDRIIIMPGSGVRSNNIIALADKTKAVEFHTSARKYAAVNMIYKNEQMKEAVNNITVDTVEIKKMIELLNNH